MATTTPNYDINYDDERLVDVKTQEQTALTENEQLYGGMIENVDQYYTGLQEQSKEYADKQAQLQQQNTDFAIEQINQQKQQAQKDYTKEQSGAYVDWQKQSNQYGAQAEQMASQGMAGSGYSESSQVGMYNTYQNRVAVARESLNKTMMNFDNNIQQAILQNNSALAEIYYNAHREQLELSLESFQYKNTLLIEQANKQQELKQFYSNEYQNVLNQMNTENALAESVRQANMQQDNWQKEYEQTIAEYNEGIRQFNEQIKLEREKMTAEAEQKAKELELARDQLEEDKRQANLSYQAKVVQNTPVVKGGNTGTQISTQYYNGTIAENVGGFGYMGKDNNGVAYQPKGVYENGEAVELTKSGKTAKQMLGKGITNSSGVNIEKQNVWKGDKYYYIWNGTANTYEIVGTV